jgi:uncharacterized protein (DUF433 family)
MNASAMKVIESSPEVMGGTPVFTGTRVPVETLMDYLEAGDSINEFLSDFPTVSRELVIEVLEMVKGNLIGAAQV